MAVKRATHKRTARDRARDRAQQRIQLLEATLTHVDFDGWGEDALYAGARDIGLDEGRAKLLFPDGVPELIGAFSAWADMKMMQAYAAVDTTELGVTAKVELAVRLRLQALAPHQEAVRRGLGVLAMPANAQLAAELTHETVDAVWHTVGDVSHDYNWYTKRATLSAVYGATVLYWLADTSEGFADTWDFLHRRLKDAVSVIAWRKKTTAKVMNALGGKLPSPAGVFERFAKAARSLDRA